MKLNADALKNGQRMVFTLPDLKSWLKNRFSNALFFEHTYLISEEYVEGILGAYNFRILEKRRFHNGHSLFYAAEKAKNCSSIEAKDYGSLYRENRDDFMNFVYYFEQLAKKYNSLADGTDEVYLFGAHIFSQMLIHFGLNIKNIVCVLDNDPLKQGKRLYGTDFLVASPGILKEKCHPVVILNAGAYTEEIESDIITNINVNTVIIK